MEGRKEERDEGMEDRERGVRGSKSEEGLKGSWKGQTGGRRKEKD